MMRPGALAAALIVVGQAWAQVPLPPAVDPGAVQQRQIDEERRRQELERLQRKPVTEPLTQPEAEKPAAKPAPEAIRFLVRAIEFTPSEILSKNELEAIARDYRGKQLSLVDLQELAERVNALYRAKGVVTARAVIPPQDISEGTVRVRLVEGRLGRISIEGNQTTSEGYVKWRLGREPGTLVDLKELERELIRFNRTTDAQLRAQLLPGETFGTTDLNLKLSEPPRHDLRLFLDNSGTESTGEWRRGLAYLNRSVFGWRDDLSLSATNADGVDSYSAAYGVPFNRWGGRARYGFYKDYTEVKYGPLATLDITGEAEAHVVSLRQPAYVAQAMQVDITGGYTKRQSETWISGVFLEGTKTETVNLGGELQAADKKGFWLAGYSITAGHAVVTSKSRYTIGRGSLRRTYELGGGWSARGLLGFQHTGDKLVPPSEQIYIGGEGSVRGYPVAVFSGYRGTTVNLELHHPLFTADGGGEAQIATTGFFFADYGYVKPFRPPNSTLRGYEELSSIGWGINAFFAKRASARLAFGYALNDLPLEPRRYAVNLQVVVSVF
jgi:hemolysin activation/secretion protein